MEGDGRRGANCHISQFTGDVATAHHADTGAERTRWQLRQFHAFRQYVHELGTIGNAKARTSLVLDCNGPGKFLAQIDSGDAGHLGNLEVDALAHRRVFTGGVVFEGTLI